MLNTIRLLSWSLVALMQDKTREMRVPQYVEVIESARPDIIALQGLTEEMTLLFKQGLRKIGYPNTQTSEEPQLLTASRWHIQPIDLHFDIPYPKRDILSAVIHTPHCGIELHNALGNPAEDDIKVNTHRGIYRTLSNPPRSTPSKSHRILCGYFNSPKSEFPDGTVEGFDDSDQAEGELSVIKGLADYDLQDTFRKLHGYQKETYSYIHRHGNTKYRFDHIFASESLNPIACNYIHYPRENRLSDHSIIYADFKPTTT